MPLREVRTGDVKELKDIADTIARSHKVLVVTGAGISTSCGIPDFRSKDGLYNMIPEHSLPTPPPSEPATPSHKRRASSFSHAETPSRKRRMIDTDDDDEIPSTQSSTSSRANRRSSGSPASRMKGQDLFHARVFHRADTTQVFNQFLAGFKQKLDTDVKDTSKTHKFIRVLRDGGRLMRCYTQNIDGLEEREGLCVDLVRGKGNKRRFMKKHYELPRPEIIQNTDFDGGCEVVQLHGELRNLRCTVCSAEEEWTEEESGILMEGAAPNCNRCNEKSEQRQATGKRGLAVGILRPNIVLYGEEHPQNSLLSPLVPYDVASNPEVLIIMGTSLKVFGMQKIIKDFAKAIHTKKSGRVVFVNRTRPAESVWDGIIDDFVEMDCDDWVEDLKQRRPGLWLRQGELDLGEIKSTATKAKRRSESSETNTDTSSQKQPKSKSGKFVSVDIPKRQIKQKKTNSTVKQKAVSKLEQTPRTSRWKSLSVNNEFRTLLSPLVQANRPPASPLSQASQSPSTSDTPSQERIPNSPETPTYSLFTPSSKGSHYSKTPSRLRIHQDADEQEQDEDTIIITPNNKPLKSTLCQTNSSKKSIIERVKQLDRGDVENTEPASGEEDDDDPINTNTTTQSSPRSLNGELVALQTEGATNDEGKPLYNLNSKSLLGRLLSTRLFT